MLSTLIFCTSYFESERTWKCRYRRWIDYYSRVFPSEYLFLIDDGSPFVPPDCDVRVNENIEFLAIGQTATIYRFRSRLGRSSAFNYPGWFRSFTFSIEIAKKLSLSKIIHIESDAYILTRRALDYLTNTNTGWTVFWCPRWSFPETALQVICSDQFHALEALQKKSYSAFSNRPVERLLPYTRVEKRVFGNRYGEYRLRVPSYADFAVQVNERTVFKSELAE